MADSPLILVVEDEFFLQADLEHALAGGGYAAEVVSSGEEALTLLMTKRHDALVTDVKLAETTNNPITGSRNRAGTIYLVRFVGSVQSEDLLRHEASAIAQTIAELP